MSSISSHNLPQITPKTHIVGICGVGEHVFEEDGAYASAPHLDGWMVSDFYLLHHLFRGNGKSQVWFTCIDPDTLSHRYGEFAHGNCYRERYVVLDTNQQPDITTMKIANPDNLLTQILVYLRDLCVMAATAKEPVLLCVFSHGEEETLNLKIGGTGDYMNMPSPVLTTAHVSSILTQNPGLNLCLLMTSCFSGGWTITPDLRNARKQSLAIVMTAAGEDVQSESWPKTESLSRACGSIYISSIVKSLESATSGVEESVEGEILDTKAFSNLVTHHLLNTFDPRFGKGHEHQFEVQVERWSEPFPTTTGFPLMSYAEKLRKLRVIPPTTLAAVNIRRDRSLTTEECEAFEERHKVTTIGTVAASNYGGSMMAMKKTLRTEASRYMKTNPGRDSLADNIAPHYLIKKCIDTPHTVSDEGWNTLFEILHYRRQSIETAELILKIMEVIAPRADTIEMGMWRMEHPELDDRSLEVYRLVLQDGLIPPFPGATKRYIKSVQYIAAACAMSDLTMAEIEARLKKAQRVVNNTVDECAKSVTSSLTFSKKAGMWITRAKKRMRSLSPSKSQRRSIMSSEGESSRQR